MDIYLEPGTGLRSRLESSFGTAVGIVAFSAGIRSAIALTTRLYPNEGVDQLIASLCAWAGTKAGSLGVTPVTPFDLASGLVAATACSFDQYTHLIGILESLWDAFWLLTSVDDEVGIPSCSR